EGDTLVNAGAPGFPANWYGRTPKIWTISWSNATGENTVEISDDPDKENCRCVEVIDSNTLDITTRSDVIGDQVGEIYTQSGLADIRRHERARRLVYQKAYKAFLEPFESPPDCRTCGLRRTKA